MSTSEYMFGDQSLADEVQRLRFVEHDYDIQSQARLQALGLADGSTCLEVGPGAGSMARWMADRVGENGTVVAVDLDDRFFPLIEPAGVQVRVADVRTVELPGDYFDFVHARLLIEHLPDRSDVLSCFARWLKPGGWVVLGDCDYSFGWRTSGRSGEVFTCLQRATVEAVAKRGVDFEYGMKLPMLLRAGGFTAVGASGSFPLVLEGSGTADLLQASLTRQRTMVDLPDVADDELDELGRQLPLGEVVQTGWVMVHAWGQKPNP